jgi:hypothetical protein
MHGDAYDYVSQCELGVAVDARGMRTTILLRGHVAVRIESTT